MKKKTSKKIKIKINPEKKTIPNTRKKTSKRISLGSFYHCANDWYIAEIVKSELRTDKESNGAFGEYYSGYIYYSGYTNDKDNRNLPPLRAVWHKRHNYLHCVRTIEDVEKGDKSRPYTPLSDFSLVPKSEITHLSQIFRPKPPQKPTCRPFTLEEISRLGLFSWFRPSNGTEFQYKLVATEDKATVKEYVLYFGSDSNVDDSIPIPSRDVFERWEFRTFDFKTDKFTPWMPCKVIEDGSNESTDEELELKS